MKIIRNKFDKLDSNVLSKFQSRNGTNSEFVFTENNIVHLMPNSLQFPSEAFGNLTVVGNAVFCHCRNLQFFLSLNDDHDTLFPSSNAIKDLNYCSVNKTRKIRHLNSHKLCEKTCYFGNCGTTNGLLFPNWFTIVLMVFIFLIMCLNVSYIINKSIEPRVDEDGVETDLESEGSYSSNDYESIGGSIRSYASIRS